MDNETWRWIWLGFAAVMGVAEIATAGFFILPFAVGGIVAFLLAWFGASTIVQWTVFIIVSLVSLVFLQMYAKKDRAEQHPVGANRFVDKTGLVLEDIDRIAAEGRVRMDTEEWRATTEGDPIRAGTEVRIVGVVGSRLLVEPVE
ncbi:MAG: NfeD family protein [Acidimicrobiia bacterium]|nr:NfeD family protein [Acidimicrobiia bacterium]